MCAQELGAPNGTFVSKLVTGIQRQISQSLTACIRQGRDPTSPSIKVFTSKGELSCQSVQEL